MRFKKKLAKFAKRNLTAVQFGRLSEFYYGVVSFINPLRVIWWRRVNVGKRAYIDSSAHFLGWKNIKIGAECVISEHCWFNVNSRVGGKIAIEIGDHSYIGRRNFFSSGKRITLGPYALTGVDCKYMGSDHIFQDPMAPYIATGVTSDGEIHIGANCWLGAGVTILGNVTIGHACIIGAGALVLEDIPPFSLAVGSPARVIKRYDVERAKWVNLEDFSNAKAALLPGEDRYLETLRAARPYIAMPRAAAGRSWGDIP